MNNGSDNGFKDKGIWLAVLAVFAGFLYLCFFNYGGMVFTSELRLYGTDPYYHVRRIWLTALSFPSLVEFDYYVNYPSGSYIQWPPGFDYLIAAVCRLLMGPGASLYEAGKVSVIVSPLLGLLAVCITGLLAARWFGRNAGILAAFLTALNPNMLHLSRVGRVDHHMLEPFFLVLVFYCFDRAVGSKGWRWSLAAALAMALSFLFVPVGGMFPVLLLGFVFVKGVCDVIRGYYDHGFGRCSIRVFLYSFFFSLAFSMTTHFGRTGSFEAGALSLFQPAVVLFSLVLAIGLYIAFGSITNKSTGKERLVMVAVGIIILLVLSAMFGPVKGGLSFLTRSDPIAASITESHSALAFGIGNHIRRMPTLILLPVLILWAVRRANRSPSAGGLLLAYWLLAATVLGAMQLRLVSFLIPALSIAIAGILSDWPEFAKRRGKANKAVVYLPPALALVLVLALSFPAIRGYAMSEVSYTTPTMYTLARMYDALIWLRDNTPRPSGLEDPAVRPEYGVMSFWDYGHHLNFYAERPNIANPFSQLGTNREGILEAARFFTEEDEEKASGLLEELGVRYLLLDNQDMGMHLGYLGKGQGESIPGGYGLMMGARLSRQNGLAVDMDGDRKEALGHFRLAYESRHDSDLKTSAGEPISYFKVFEFVEGARVYGNTKPDTPVSAEVNVRTNRGRRFVYSVRTMSDREGHYELSLPYPTVENPYETGAAGPYRIGGAGRAVEVEIQEIEVTEGRSIRVDIL